MNQNPQPQVHENPKTHTTLNLQNQHSFHIILCMSYSIWPMGLAAHNLNQLHHIILEIFYSKICHITQFRMCASA